MNKTALITGASSGIGLELAKVFASRQHNLILVARNVGAMQKLVEIFPSVKIKIVPLDLSKPNAAMELFQQIENEKIDYLINNAGFGDFGFFHESDWNKQSEMIQLNITTLTQLTHLVLPSMIKNGGGKILNVASTAAFQPGPTMSVYYATKAFVLHFSEAINNELKPFQITVTALCPGPTASGFQSAADLGDSKLVKGKKLPSAADVAEYGYKAMMQGKAVAIHGARNYILANSIRFTPRNWVVKIVRSMQEKGN